MKINTKIGENIRAKRKELKMTQKTLGEVIGVSHQQIQRYETARNGVSADKLYNIAMTLDVSIECFFKGIKSKK